MNKKIVVVDDEDGLRLVVVKILENAGYCVFEAADGDYGLEVTRRELPDLVITDNQMVRIDGLELVRGIKREGITSRIIVFSSLDSELNRDVVQQYRDEGVSTFLHKPTPMDELLAVVARELDQGQQNQ